MKKITIVYIAFIGLLSTATASAQSNISLSGQAQMAPLPTSLLPGVFENDLSAEVYLEASNLILTRNVRVDATSSGSYDLERQLTPGVIAAGTLVSDVMLQTDPVRNGTEFTGSITFSSDILGVIVESSLLTATDNIFGVSGVTYPGSDRSRGFELISGQDGFSLSQDMHTLNFDVNTYGNIDEIRIVTAGTVATAQFNSEKISQTPEPDTYWLLALGVGALACGKFKGAARRSPRA